MGFSTFFAENPFKNSVDIFGVVAVVESFPDLLFAQFAAQFPAEAPPRPSWRYAGQFCKPAHG